MSSTLAEAIKLVDPAKGEAMVAQYEAARQMMAQAGVTL